MEIDDDDDVAYIDDDDEEKYCEEEDYVFDDCDDCKIIEDMKGFTIISKMFFLYKFIEKIL